MGESRRRRYMYVCAGAHLHCSNTSKCMWVAKHRAYCNPPACNLYVHVHLHEAASRNPAASHPAPRRMQDAPPARMAMHAWNAPAGAAAPGTCRYRPFLLRAVEAASIAHAYWPSAAPTAHGGAQLGVYLHLCALLSTWLHGAMPCLLRPAVRAPSCPSRICHISYIRYYMHACVCHLYCGAACI